jgi:hypothetical protein
MATYTWPSGRAWIPQQVTFGVQTNTRTNTSPLSGATQTVTLPGSRWVMTVTMPPQRWADRRALLALLVKTGGDNVLQMGDQTRSRPRGTINTAGVTASAAAQFATTLTLNGCGASTTLLAGDLLSVGGQLLMNTDDATASAGGVMTVTVRHMLRAAVTGGAAVTLAGPTSLWRLENPDVVSGFESADLAPAMSFGLVEVFA